MILFASENFTVTESGCWEWSRATTRGYGVLRHNGRVVRAHRLAVEIATGVSLTRTEVVMHKCDNPPCINPDHLSVANQAANLKDMRLKGRDQGFARSQRSQTHCRHGHEFTEGNTYRWRGGRRCATCRSIRNAARDRRATTEETP